MLIDDMDDATDRAYVALPSRLFLIGWDGRVASKCDRGTMGTERDELELAVEAHLAEINV